MALSNKIKRAASSLWLWGILSASAIVTLVSQQTGLPRFEVASELAEAFKQRGPAHRYDRRVALYVPLSQVDAAKAGYQLAVCEDLDDWPSLHAKCIAKNSAPFVRRVCDLSETHRGFVTLFPTTPQQRQQLVAYLPAQVQYLLDADLNSIKAALATVDRKLCEYEP